MPVVVLALSGCYHVPEGRRAVDRVDIRQNVALSDHQLLDRMATDSSPKFLGIWDGVAFDYAYFDPYVLEADLKRVQRLYRARGYYDAVVRAGRVISTSPGHVRVEIVVDEGAPVSVVDTKVQGFGQLPFEVQAGVMNVMDDGLGVGDRFDEDSYEETKKQILTFLQNHGFAWARVKGQVTVNVLNRKASIVYQVDAGPKFHVRAVLFSGMRKEMPEDWVRRVFAVRAGDLFSAEKIQAGTNALLDLGVFASVDATWPRGGDNQRGTTVPRASDGTPVVDVLVNVTPAPVRTIKLGIGSEVDVVRTDIHGLVGWESRNFLGGLRRLSITAQPGGVLFPMRVPDFMSPERVLPEGKLRVELRQPGFIEPSSAGLLRANVSVFPLLLPKNPNDLVLGYRELRGAVGVERPFFSNRLYTAVFFHAQAYYPFTYVGELDDSLSNVFISYAQLITNLDFRDDPIHPHRGVFLGNDLQLAGGLLGGDIDDVKIQPELRMYAPISKTVTFAVRTTVGFLLPRNYGRSLDTTLREDDARDQQLLYFRALFSGGPSSNRGYPYRAVGPHGPGWFLSPNISAQQLQESCNPTSTAYDPAKCKVPLGGLTLWEASAEVRFPLLGPLTAALFADSSDVTRYRIKFLFNYPHLSVGGGLRYDTPVGPLRLDIGYRVPGLQKIGGDLAQEEGDPGTIFGLPIAYSLAVGESF